MDVTQDVKKIYGGVLREMMQTDHNIMAVDADLMRIAGTDQIAEEFPEQYVNTGIAEQNAVSLAAGLALMGKTVFVSAFCEFLGTRASDQCLDTVCYNELNVKLVGTYAGVSSGINGGTHISINDLAAFRSMPGMTVIEVADGREMAWAIREAVQIEGPVYIRVPKGPLHEIFSQETNFQIGKSQVLSKIADDAQVDRKVALVTSGITTMQGVKATEQLREKGIPITHLHLTSVKPMDREGIVAVAKTHDVIITVDNHSVIGGIGDAVCAITAEAAPVKVVRLGIQDVFCEGMTEQQLMERYGFSAKKIVDKVNEIICSAC